MSDTEYENEEVVHVYDDIEELDNKLPRWWVLLFYICIAFAPFYMGYYHVFGIGDSSAEKYEKAEAKVAAAVAEKEAAAAASGEVKVLEPSTDPQVLAKGQTAFMTYCMACHFTDGGGMVGPNLTDDYWLTGHTFADNVKTIEEGVPERGMIPWKTMLKPADIEAVASYIYTFRGTTAANPKGPEGKKVDADGNVVDEKPRLVAPPVAPAP
jgi:cytochrome c oxidase cbb3-type subunit 3